MGSNECFDRLKPASLMQHEMPPVVRVGASRAVNSALALGLLYPSHPTLGARVSTSRSCQHPNLPHFINDGLFSPTSGHKQPNQSLREGVISCKGDLKVG
jgi:hypothetical protein